MGLYMGKLILGVIFWYMVSTYLLAIFLQVAKSSINPFPAGIYKQHIVHWM